MIISLLIALLIVGVVLWAITQIPMDPAIANIIRVVAIVGVVIWLISLLTGVGTPLTLR